MNNEFSIRKAKKEEARLIYQGMQRVYEELENKELFVCDDLDWVEAHLEEQGFAVVACDGEGNIAGSLIVRYPGNSEDNLGRDLGLPDYELQKVAHMEAAVVLPEYRGKHLQRALLQYAEAVIDTRRYRYLMCTVSPQNPASYKSMEACGYQLKLTKEKYGGLQRRIYCKAVGENV